MNSDLSSAADSGGSADKRDGTGFDAERRFRRHQFEIRNRMWNPTTREIRALAGLLWRLDDAEHALVSAQTA